MTINWTNITTMEGLLTIPNQNSGDWFYIAVLYTFTIILYTINSKYGFTTALIMSSFFSSIVGILLVYSGLIVWYWTAPLIFMLVFAIVIHYYR